MRIPTILGLALLSTAVILGLIIISFQPGGSSDPSVKPNDVKVVNVTDSSATIIWTTQSPTIGEVSFKEKSKAKQTVIDDRDNLTSTARTTHYVTLQSLTPATGYNYEINSNGSHFSHQAFSFKTAPTAIDFASVLNYTNQDLYKPIQGSLINQNLEVVNDAIVIFKLDGASEQATFVASTGSFLLPIANLRTEDLAGNYELNNGTTIRLLIKGGNIESNVDISLPLGAAMLPPIQLGENTDLKAYVQKEIKENPSFHIQPIPEKRPIDFDLNADGDINSLDLALLNQNRSRRTTDKKFDLNGDDKVDATDVTVMRQKLQESDSKPN